MSDLTFELSENMLVVTMDSRLDTNTSPQLEKFLADKLTSDDVRGLILDFEPTEYISSAGLRVILLAAKKMKSSGGKLVLCRMSAHVKEVFDIAGFTAVLNIEKSRDMAVAQART